MKNSENGELISPWHDIEIESSTNKDNTITGIIEITKGTNKKLECSKETEGNPIMQDYTTVKGVKQHRFYSKPPDFNYGFIPQTFCDEEFGGDGDAIDLIDLSWKELKPVLAVSDYLVLGIMGLVD